jgi:hypothetical protein
MSTFKLSLPTDIPWRRICVSGGKDADACDEVRPPRWRSSIAVFRFDPAEDYQPYEQETVSYLKVVITVGPYQADEIGVGELASYVPPELIDKVEVTYPCYAAVLQATVAPTASQQDDFPAAKYPYFIAFEPKKRELYEQVTDTGEVLSGSLDNVSVGKSATNTTGLEDYHLDLGGGGGVGLGWGLVSGNWNSQEQTGTVSRTTNQVQNVRTTDFSTERREVQSHTTQLTQMYNLLQSFHLGTNRAVFLIEPRPHIQQVERTFFGGPRELEGTQEIFMIVVRPRTMTDFCVSTLLETAHILYEETESSDKDVVTKEWVESYESDDPHPMEQVVAFNFEPAEGWEIDLGHPHPYAIKTKKKFKVIFGQPQVTVDHLRLIGEMGPGGKLDAAVEIRIRTKDAALISAVRKLFLSARELCCCPPTRARPANWISYEKDMTAYNLRFRTGRMSRLAFEMSRQMARMVRSEMVRSFGSSRRADSGRIAYADSDAFLTLLGSVLKSSRHQRTLTTPLVDVPILDTAVKARLQRVLGRVTAGDMIAADSVTLQRALELDVAQVAALKKDLIRWVRQQSPDHS